MHLKKYILYVILSINSGLFCLGQIYTEDYKITKKAISRYIDASGYYGSSMDLDNNWLVVGAHGDSYSGNKTGFNDRVFGVGSAYVYKRNLSTGEWDYFQKLTPEDTTYTYAEFGISVSIHENQIAVGAYWTNDGGEVYIFKLNQNSNKWEREQIIISPHVERNYNFATSVKIQDSLLHVSGDGDSENNKLTDYQGSVYVYKKNLSNGKFEYAEKIVAENRYKHSAFGNNFEQLQKDQLLITAPLDSIEEYRPGSVYIFQKDQNEYVLTQQLLPHNTTYNSLFGADYAINDDFLFISATLYPNGDKINQGRVFVYEFTSEKKYEKVSEIIPDINSQDSLVFGLDIAVTSSNVLLVSTLLDDYTGDTLNEYAGAVIRYVKDAANKWYPVDTLKAAYGYEINLFDSGKGVVISSPLTRGNFNRSDANSYLYSYNLPQLNTSISDFSIKNSYVNIYPNPVNDKLFIDSEQAYFVQIYDVKGGLVKNLSHTSISNSFDVSDLKSGVYMVKLYRSRTAEVFKFVKH